MRADKDEAIAMRKAGKSYKEIRHALKIPLSTLSDWFNGEEWSKEIHTRLDASNREGNRVRLRELNRIRGKDLASTYDNARAEARTELAVLKYHPVFVAGVMLYWGEGDKASWSGVRMSNTDPQLLKLFIAFLCDVCGLQIKDIKASVLVYPDLDESVCRRYWSAGIGLPIENFTKSITIQGRHKTKRLGYGVCIVAVGRTYLKKKILEWIRLLPDELMRGKYYASM